MKKKFTILIAAAVMLLTMMAQPGTLWGQTPVTLVSGSGTSGYVVPYGWTSTGTVAGGSYLKFDNGTITSPAFDPHTGLLFEYSVATFGSGTNHPLTIRILNASTDAIITEQETATPTSSSYISTGSPLDLGDVDVEFKIQMYAPTGKGIRLRNYSITGIPSGSGSTTPTTVTIDATNLTNTDVYVSVEAGSLSATVKDDENNVIDGATVTWTSSATGVSTVDGNGVVTLVAAGTTIITATYAGDETYSQSSNTYELEVTDSTPFEGVIFDATTDTGTSPIVKDNVSLACTNGVLNNGSEYRLYKNSTTTISTIDGSTITKIEFTCVSGYAASNFTNQTGWTTSGDNGVWEGGAESVSFVASGAQVRATMIKVTVEQNTDPAIVASNPEELVYNSTSGSINYTIYNYVAGTMSASTEADWITEFNYQQGENGTVGFSTSTNPVATQRSATVTLTYTYGTRTTVTKDVTVSQAGNPNVVDDVSSITGAGDYKVRGTVLAVSARAFVLGDGTGYVYYYNGNNAPSVVVNEKKVIEGTTSGDYGHVIQFQNTATITATETSNYDGTPAVTVINEIPDYTSGLHLSDYFQFDGTLTKNNDYYYVSCGEGNINISYPSSTQQTAMDAMESKDVRVKGYFAGINSSDYFSVILESIEKIVAPTISINPASASPFTYVQGAGPSEEQVFEVTGENLTSDDIVATITSGVEYFEITDDQEYSNTVTVNSGDYISVRLKAGLGLSNNYSGVLTLTNEGAENVVVDLTGSVTGATYTINLDDNVAGGTIEADKASAAEGETVTLTAHPDAAYTFGSWTVYKDDMSTEVTVTDNQFIMPACEVYVSAYFNAKPTYAVTCVADPTAGGIIDADPTSAYEGQTITLSYLAEDGYSLAGIVITKTEDGSATNITLTAINNGYTFTMPDYAVTATATFLSETYTGSFVKFTGDALEEGDYILVYNGKAMNNDNTSTSNKLGATEINVSTNIITDPSRSIVWHIAPIGTEGKWTLYNAFVNQYVNASASNSTNVTLVDNASYSNGAKWSVTIDGNNNTYDFSNLSSTRALRYYESSDVFGHYATSNGGPLTLYKYAVLTERTITFNGNGGLYQGNETYTQTVYDGIATNLTANQFAQANSVFVGWSTTQDGEVVYADGASITVAENDINLYAQWSTSYTAMVDDQIVGGTVLINGEEIVEVAEGTELTLTYTANTGYVFDEWNVYKEGDETTTINVENNKFTMPAYDVVVSATFVEVTTYSLVTSIDNIVSGKHYIIASGTNGSVKVMAGQSSNNRSSVSTTATNGIIPETTGIFEFVINGPEKIIKNNDTVDVYTIYDTQYPGYLYAASSSANHLKTRSDNSDANSQWKIEIAATTSVATIKAQGNYTRNWMRNNSGIFACYSSGQTDIYLYVKDNDTVLEYYGSEITYTESTIQPGEILTIGTGSVMTINNDNFTNDSPANLIIVDGGQIVHDNAGVKAIFKKNITGYGTGTGNYYFLVSPFIENINPENVTNMIAATLEDYDLYRWNSSETDEWRNYKQEAFTLNNGIGYLYANKNNVELTFTGTLKQSNEVVTVDADHITADFGDWSLVGNPFPCNAYIVEASTGMSFYRMNTAGTDFVAATGAIKPMEGIFIQTTAENQSFKFTRTAPTEGGKGNLNLQVAKVVNSRDAQPASDNAIIRFDGGSSLEKFSFRNDNSKVYITRGNKDYAVVSADNQGEMPVNFKAAEDGNYTIDFTMDNVEFGYLHLIDHMTGMDVDLLQTPSYTFNARTRDYASRFRLVFKTNGVNENENVNENDNFGFISNGNLMILGIEGEATLQVIDVTGRILSTETFSGSYNKAVNAAQGVYMIRLIQGENVRTQKIVIK